jgi:tRNA (cmo5U34)-methyltransferase
MNAPVHFPANPDKFEFDAEVAKIFPNMAKRSIPNYEQFHELHAGITARLFPNDGARMLDVGASHGAFFQHLFRQFWRGNDAVPKYELTAIDTSPAMCATLRTFFPQAKVLEGDITDARVQVLLAEAGPYDVVNATYVIQFIHPDLQKRTLRFLASLVREGGILILGQKDKISTSPLSALVNERYIDWRVDNGYTRKEIDAKTRALQNAMWPMYHDVLMETLMHLFRDVQQTTRTFMFNTLIAYK